MKLFKSNHQNIFALLFFVLTVGVFFYPTILKGKLPVPSDSLVGMYHPWRDLYSTSYPRGVPFKNFLITDPVRQQIPWRKLVVDAWKAGKLPSWNPYSFSGTPLVANIQAAPFYPLNFIFLFLDFATAWTIIIMLQPLLAGIFLYFYLRHLKLLPISSLFGAIIWAFCGFNLAWLTWGTIGHVILWLPLILLAIDKQWRGLLILGLAMQFLAGHSQVSLYLMLLAFFYGIRKLKLKFFWSGLIIFMVLTAIQWLPMLKFLPDTSRLAASESWKQAGWFLPWQHLVQFFAPDFFGNPATGNYWGIWNYGEFIGYIGIGSLIFVLISLGNFKDKFVKFWITIMVTCLIFALPNPLSKLVYQLQLPIISSLQPTRLMAIIDFALVMLASFGFNQWLANKQKQTSKIILILFSILAILWILVLKNHLAVAQRNLILPTVVFTAISLLALVPFKRITVYLILLITVFDLLRFGWKFTPFTSQEYFFSKTKIIEFLQKQAKPFRVMSLDPRILPANVGAYYDLEMIEGYDPLYNKRYEQFLAAVARGKPEIQPPYGFNRILAVENIDSPLLPLLNVRYVLALNDVARPFLLEVLREGETRLYEDLRYQPRYYVGQNILKVGNDQEEISSLFTNQLRAIATTQESLLVRSQPLSRGESYSLKEYSNNRLVFETNFSTSRLLVITNNFDYGWKAKIGKAPAKIYRINYTFQGIIVPPGKQEVVVYY